MYISLNLVGYLPEVLVVRHVSVLYSNTNLAFVWNIHIFVVTPITPEVYTFLRMWKCALASSIRVFTSASVPATVPTILPRYVNASTSSSPIIFVFFLDFLLVYLGH